VHTRDQGEVSPRGLHLLRRALRVLSSRGLTLGFGFVLPRYLRDGARGRNCNTAANARAREEEARRARGEDAFWEDEVSAG